MRVVLADLTRGLCAAGVMLSAVVHLDLWQLQGFRQIDVIGPLFLLNAVGGLVIGVAIVCWRHWLALLAGVGFGLVTLAAFWVSVVHGLFGLKEVATGPAQLLAEVAEIVAVVCGVLAVALLRPRWTVPAFDRAHRAR